MRSRSRVNNFTGSADLEAKETWALNFFKDNLLATHFTPSLTVGTIVGGFPQSESLDAVRTRGDAMRPPATPAPAKPAADEPATRPGPAADPEDSATVGTGNGGGTPGAVRAPAAGADGESATEGTGEAASAATAAQLGSAAASGVVIPAAAAPGVPSGAASAATPATPEGDAPPQAVASFRFRGITQEERKTITLSYSRAEAAQRVYAPQGVLRAAGWRSGRGQPFHRDRSGRSVSSG